MGKETNEILQSGLESTVRGALSLGPSLRRAATALKAEAARAGPAGEILAMQERIRDDLAKDQPDGV